MTLGMSELTNYSNYNDCSKVHKMVWCSKGGFISKGLLLKIIDNVKSSTMYNKTK